MERLEKVERLARMERVETVKIIEILEERGWRGGRRWEGGRGWGGGRVGRKERVGRREEQVPIISTIFGQVQGMVLIPRGRANSRKAVEELPLSYTHRGHVRRFIQPFTNSPLRILISPGHQNQNKQK